MPYPTIEYSFTVPLDGKYNAAEWSYVHCLVSSRNKGYRSKGINYLFIGMKPGSPKNDCNNLVAPHGIVITGIHTQPVYRI